MRPLAAIIMAAGEGSRLNCDGPKALFRCCGHPMIDASLEAVRAIDPERILVVISPGEDGERIVAHIGDGVQYVTQTEPRGTGDAVFCCYPKLEAFEGDILILPCDKPRLTGSDLQHLLATHYGTHSDATVLTAFVDDPGGYGRIERGEDGQIARIVEDAPSDAPCEVNGGIYVIDSSCLWRLPWVARLTDAIGYGIRAGMLLRNCTVTRGGIIGVNIPEDAAKAEHIGNW